MGLFSKIFGKSNGKGSGEAGDEVHELLSELLDVSGLDLDFELDDGDENTVTVDFEGEDSRMLIEKDGQLLDSIQFFVTRVLQHKAPGERFNINFDCNGFREKANKELIKLAEKLKSVVVEKNKSVYFRALPPKDRKVIHQYLADDKRVKSRSIGDGHFKKIKIYPASQEKKGSNHRSAER